MNWEKYFFKLRPSNEGAVIWEKMLENLNSNFGNFNEIDSNKQDNLLNPILLTRFTNQDIRLKLLEMTVVQI